MAGPVPVQRSLALAAAQLYRRCDPGELPFQSTLDLRGEVVEGVGQARALNALQFGLGIAREGFNIFVMGPAGTGKHTICQRAIGKCASRLPAPADWVYLHNFDDAGSPIAVPLAAGKGAELRSDMVRLIDELRAAISQAFSSDVYRGGMQKIERSFEERRSRELERVRQAAADQGVAMLQTPAGVGFAPTREGKPLQPEEFERLPEEERLRIGRTIDGLHVEMHRVLDTIPQWRREARERVRELNRDTVLRYVASPIEELAHKWTEYTRITDHLASLREDVIENVSDFLQEEAEDDAAFIVARQVSAARDETFRRYTVNVMVDNSRLTGAPIVYETHPSYDNLVGRVEHQARLGALFTDFTLVRPGALHRANGGFLILDAQRLLQSPYAWEGLKRSLRGKEIRIESVERLLSLMSTTSLNPDPIPLDVKVVLIGERRLYYLLHELDPDFWKLFKVAADFEDDVARDAGSQLAYARLAASMAEHDRLRPLSRRAMARVIEESSRWAADATKLSCNTGLLSDLLREADHWAEQADSANVEVDHVEAALLEQRRRFERERDRLHAAIGRGTLLVETAGTAAGQVNGLSVASRGAFVFGWPSRITATVRLGDGEVVDIERDVELGGPVHSKGVLILASFLGQRFARGSPLSLRASLVFEQSYGTLEGDSASSAELLALLSCIADVPLRQGLAVTGSVNQLGQVQAVGAVNEKVEGFFDVCRARGLDGSHGVVIPRANRDHLMLRKDVVAAVAEGRFHVYAVEHIDEVATLLAGMPAGAPDATGDFPHDSFNGRVARRLQQLAEAARQWGHGGRAGGEA